MFSPAFLRIPYPPEENTWEEDYTRVYEIRRLIGSLPEGDERAALERRSGPLAYSVGDDRLSAGELKTLAEMERTVWALFQAHAQAQRNAELEALRNAPTRKCVPI